jgi:hypothetical protein
MDASSNNLQSFLAADIAILHFGAYPASVDDETQGPAQTLVESRRRYVYKSGI